MKQMRQIIHMCHSIVGPLKNWNDRDWDDAIEGMTKEGGFPFRNGRELRASFVEELINGNHYVPIGKCSNFDPKKGCMGHIIYNSDWADFRHDFSEHKNQYHPDVEIG